MPDFFVPGDADDVSQKLDRVFRIADLVQVCIPHIS